MKMKKIVSAFLAMALAASATALSGFAASPISQESKTVVFDQSFAKLSGPEDLSDFDVTGTWNYFTSYMAQKGNYNCNGSVLTKENYDLTEYTSWTFETNMISNANGYYIYLGYDKAAGKGYKLHWHNGNSTNSPRLELYKVGDDVNYVAQKTLSSLFGADVNYTISFSNNTLSISQNGTEVISYGVTADEFNGKFGVQGQAASLIILMDMKLTQGRGTAANYWIYEEDFDGETVESLTAKGWNLNGGSMSADGTYFAPENNRVTYMPLGNTISGSYGTKATVYQGYNSYNCYLAISGNDGYEYRIYATYDIDDKGELPDTNAAIVKCKSSTATTDLTDDNVLAKAEKTYGKNYQTIKYDVKVIVNEEGSVTIKADIASGTKTVSLEATDSTDPITISKPVIQYSSSDGRRLEEFSVYTIVDEAEKETVSYEKEVIDKTFTSDDNYNTIKSDFSGTVNKSGNEYSFRTYPRYTDEGGLECSGQSIWYNYADTSSDYNIEADMYRKYNYSYLYFNADDTASTYYAIESKYQSGDKWVRLYKVDSTGTTELDIESGLAYNQAGAECWSNYKVNCDYQDDGSLNITVVFKGGKAEAVTLTATDKAPLTGNNIRFYANHTGKTKRIRITAPTTEADCDGDMPVFNPRFYNADGKAITRIEDGAIYAKSFAMLLGEHTITAAIYENGIMTGIKTINPFELTSNVKLFDVTDAANTEIKLFVFDSGKSLNKVIQTCELN